MKRLALMLLCATACGGADPSKGLDLMLRIRDAQLVRGELPTEGNAPTVTQVELVNATIHPGDTGVRLAGRVTGDAFAVHLMLEGDPGYWIRKTTVSDDVVPTELQFTALADYSKGLKPGTPKLFIQAASPEGNGPVTPVSLNVPDETPRGELVFSMTWDAPVDADLYVTDPNGVTLSPKNINSVQQGGPGSAPLSPDVYKTGAYLDVDSNSSCVIDGRQQENAIYPTVQKTGTYRVWAVLAYPCNQPRAAFHITARRNGELLAQADGVLYASDARGSPTDLSGSPGLLALEVNVP